MAIRIHLTAEGETMEQAWAHLINALSTMESKLNAVPHDGTGVGVTLLNEPIGVLSVENDRVMSKMPLRRVRARTLSFGESGPAFEEPLPYKPPADN